MAYGALGHRSQLDRLEFLATSICSQDIDKNKATHIHSPQSHKPQSHEPQSHEQQSQHDHCLQGCFLCAFCLSYQNVKGSCAHDNIDGHLITWLPITANSVAIHYASNQARAPPVFINIST
ncbi:hypothetical protein [Bartonella sp. HY406]|uniref:hypothetical protein n=1 Tax=Bartonella sp. HY406 TaxID=2979331 RepID=UPI0021C992C4|nr:hypothetical protein [Bartonella sp. HY406]UXN04123.1 hypothetical protein N6B01_03565 [Bartonella sp. HY406]